METFLIPVGLLILSLSYTTSATECPLCHKLVIESTNKAQLQRCLPESRCANNVTLYCLEFRIEDFRICISQLCTRGFNSSDVGITNEALFMQCTELFLILCSDVTFEQLLKDCFALCDADTLVARESKEENFLCDKVAQRHCRTGVDDIGCAQRCSNEEKCEQLLDGMLDGEFTNANVDASVSMIRTFSRRADERVYLALNRRLGTVERLHAAFSRRPDLAVEYFGSNNSMAVMHVFDELLDDAERDEWQSLQQEFGYGPSLLYQIENAILLVGEMFNEGQEGMFQFPGQNLVMNIECATEGSQYVHRLDSNSTGFSSNVALEIEIFDSGQDTTCSVVASTFIARNLEEYVNMNSSNDVNVTMANTPLLSFQLSNNVNYLQKPLKLTFTPINEVNISNHTCSFWDFDEGDWSNENVTTEFNGSHYTCTATHLTTFAVLVDVTSSDVKYSSAESLALSIVGYIGCSISIVCLSLTILCFAWFRKSLNKGALLYIHLNLAVSLLIALVIFVSGIETAKSVNWLCTLVAALLHYFFLSVFCWMLAEGIMLYLLVVRVFGTAAEKWYYLLALGWGLPLPIVAISVGIRYKYYGTINFCWLSVEKGTIWTFVAPMLVIIMVNIVFLLLTVVSIVKVRRKATAENPTTFNLVRAAVKSAFLLLPLLGLTWVFGLLAVNNNTSVFAWLFTIFNSLQGSFIFIFHALRNEKVFGAIKRKLFMIGEFKSSKTTSVDLVGVSNIRCQKANKLSVGDN